jgi:hypothetical protein
MIGERPRSPLFDNDIVNRGLGIRRESSFVILALSVARIM